MNSSQELKEFLYRLEVDLVGVASASDPSLQEEILRYDHWLASGFGADMHYLKRHRNIKANPKLFLEEVRSVVAIGVNYAQNDFLKKDWKDGTPCISIYSLGLDYHEVLAAILKKAQDFLNQKYPGSVSRLFVDKDPVLDRFWAVRAGLGWIGKNTCMIHKKAGSFIFLGGLMTTVEFQPDGVMLDHCGRCTLCIDACPTQALEKPKVLNADKCIAYHTIENRGEVPRVVAEKMGSWVVGCDICQRVCPWNDPVEDARLFKPLNVFQDLSFEKLKNWGEVERQEARQSAGFSRMKQAQLDRNIKHAQAAKRQS